MALPAPRPPPPRALREHRVNECVNKTGLAWGRLCPPAPGLRSPANPGCPLAWPSPDPMPPPPLQSTFESQVSEISISQSEINLALRNLRAWMKDEKVSKNLVRGPRGAGQRTAPLGGEWNSGARVSAPHRSPPPHPGPGHTAGLGLHPEGALRPGAHHRPVELPCEPDSDAPGGRPRRR